MINKFVINNEIRSGNWCGNEGDKWVWFAVIVNILGDGRVGRVYDKS